MHNYNTSWQNNRRPYLTTEADNNLNTDKKSALIDIINSLEDLIKLGDIHKFKNVTNNLHKVDRNILNDIIQDPRITLKNTNLVVLACKYDKLHILQYIIHESNILYNFPPSDAKITNLYKDDAIYYATKSMNIDLLNTLYDHFLDELHWSCNHQNQNTVQTIKELNAILIKTWINCGSIITDNLQMLVDLHCLIEISHFQIELYTELSKIQYNISDSTDVRIAEAKTAVKLLLTVLKIYRKYNTKDIRLPSDAPGLEIRLQILFADKTSIYMKNIHEFMYDVYYRKLDSTASLLILDNLHYLQQRLELPNDEYQKIESGIYYFINRVYEDWRLFLPRHREKTKVEYLVDTFDHGQKYKAAAIYDQTKMLLGPVLYLSRKDFCNALSNFEDKGKKLPIVEINRQTLIPLMRDNFSLKKILIYLESLSKVDLNNDKDFGILMIERTIQVVGELFKTTNESVHLDPLTKSLLEFEIPSTIIDNLKNMRDFLSHSEKGRLLRRIHVLNKEADCFKEVLKDLNELKERIYEVINLYDPVIDEWTVEKGLSIIKSRKEELPVEKLDILKIQLTTLPPVTFPKVYIRYENTLMTEHNISRQLLREIQSLNTNEDELSAIHECIKEYLIRLVINKLDKFREAIREKLQDIENQYVPETEECLKEWEFIIKLFEYIVIVAGFLDNHHYEIKRNSFSKMINNLKSRVTCQSGIQDAYNLLDIIENHAASYTFKFDNNLVNSIAKINPNHEFVGIPSLKATLDKHPRFIIDEELNHLLDDFKKSYGEEADKVYKTHEKSFEKIKNNIPIPGADRNKLCSLKLDKESIRVIRCLDMGANRDSKLQYCFENRIKFLKCLLENTDNNVKDLALRYKHDEKFRLTLEMLLIDIMNVLKHIKETDALTKQNKMYTDANIRNILEHSEPVLEVIGQALDPNDFATELAEKALEFVKKSDNWMIALQKLKK
ncbi:hypothetical protein K1T71_013104 [Dendrolimus kikuchii]|uniref:Uncharacterized protein n=1 Tax=Dendrolimus kikuchii TaxID=765133 RepID=A0ACC1CIZ5_9NEOP|nr:hypothetical protein K1T71_013104 [Dendrolimus kikuchii]